MKRPRKGISLLEIATVVTIVGLLLTVSSGAIHAVFRRETTERAARRTRQSLLELSYRFRRDAVLAESVRFTNESCEWRLAGGETIVYRAKADGIERERSFTGSSNPQREFYSLEGARGEFQANPRNARLLLLSVHVDPTPIARFEVPKLAVMVLLPAAVDQALKETSP